MWTFLSRTNRCDCHFSWNYIPIIIYFRKFNKTFKREHYSYNWQNDMESFDFIFESYFGSSLFSKIKIKRTQSWLKKKKLITSIYVYIYIYTIIRKQVRWGIYTKHFVPILLISVFEKKWFTIIFVITHNNIRCFNRKILSEYFKSSYCVFFVIFSMFYLFMYVFIYGIKWKLLTIGIKIINKLAEDFFSKCVYMICIVVLSHYFIIIVVTLSLPERLKGKYIGEGEIVDQYK